MSGAQAIMKRLQDAEQEFSVILDTLFENPHLGFVMVDRDGIITRINTTFLKLLGNLPKRRGDRPLYPGRYPQLGIAGDTEDRPY